MLRRLGQILLFAVLCGSSALALLLLFPGLKEGAGRDELPLYIGTLAGLMAIGAAWWFASRHRLARAAGLFVLAGPMLGHGVLSVSIVAAQFEGARLASSVEIVGYRESPIAWRGFDGPVGLQIEVDLRHPEAVRGLIYPPEIRMGPWIDIRAAELAASHRAGAGYFRPPDSLPSASNLALMKSVLFQPTDREPAYQDFAAGEVTRLTYRLYPGMIAYLDEPEQICLASETPGLPVCAEGRRPEEGCRRADRPGVARQPYSQGDDLTALWFVAGRFDMVADLSTKLTDTIRRESALQKDSEKWRAMQRRLDPDVLPAAGYDLCLPGPASHTAFRVCYCRR